MRAQWGRMVRASATKRCGHERLRRRPPNVVAVALANRPARRLDGQLRDPPSRLRQRLNARRVGPRRGVPDGGRMRACSRPRSPQPLAGGAAPAQAFPAGTASASGTSGPLQPGQNRAILAPTVRKEPGQMPSLTVMHAMLHELLALGRPAPRRPEPEAMTRQPARHDRAPQPRDTLRGPGPVGAHARARRGHLPCQGARQRRAPPRRHDASRWARGGELRRRLLDHDPPPPAGRQGAGSYLRGGRESAQAGRRALPGGLWPATERDRHANHGGRSTTGAGLMPGTCPAVAGSMPPSSRPTWWRCGAIPAARCRKGSAGGSARSGRGSRPGSGGILATWPGSSASAA